MGVWGGDGDVALDLEWGLLSRFANWTSRFFAPIMRSSDCGFAVGEDSCGMRTTPGAKECV